MKDILHRLFIPSEKNNYQSKILHTDFLTYCLSIIILVAFIYQKTPIATVLGIATDMSVDRLLELTNQKRAENNLGSLHVNEKLNSAACAKASDMMTKDYWAHFGPNGESPWSFILGSGYRYTYAGENLCKNFMTSSGCVEAWMDSPTHHDNMVRSVYTDIGFCVKNGKLTGEDTTLVVQMFGTPASQPIALAKPVEASATKPIATIPTVSKTITEIVSPTAGSAPIIAKITEAPKETSLRGVAAKKLVSVASQTPLYFTQFFIVLLGAALLFDFYYAYKLRLVRMSGKHIAHFIFLAVILVSLFIIRKGVIL